MCRAAWTFVKMRFSKWTRDKSFPHFRQTNVAKTSFRALSPVDTSQSGTVRLKKKATTKKKIIHGTRRNPFM